MTDNRVSITTTSSKNLSSTAAADGCDNIQPRRKQSSGRFRYVSASPDAEPTTTSRMMGKIVRDHNARFHRHRTSMESSQEHSSLLNDNYYMNNNNNRVRLQPPMEVIDLKHFREEDFDHIYGYFKSADNDGKLQSDVTESTKDESWSVTEQNVSSSTTSDLNNDQHHNHQSWQTLLDDAEWILLYENIEFYEPRPYMLHEKLLLQDTTVLHVAAWKAPPALTLRLLEILSNYSYGESLSGCSGSSILEDYLLTADADGNTPLACACANLESKQHQQEIAAAIDFSVVKNLLILAPEALKMGNIYGDTALHLLLASKAFRKSSDYAVEAAAEEAITSLLSVAEDLAFAHNNNGCTLLHVAIANDCYEQVLLQLLAMAHESVEIADERGMLPIHYAAAYGNLPWTVVGQLIWTSPNSICCQTAHGDTPLHLLVANAKINSQEWLKNHLRKKRQEISENSSDNTAELELANFYYVDRCTVKFAEALSRPTEQGVDPLLITNDDGVTPLHCCALFDAPAQITRTLLQSGSTDAVWAASILKSNAGATPLHLAIASMGETEKEFNNNGEEEAWWSNVTSNILYLIMKEACVIHDACDRTPLMLAVESKRPSLAVIKAILEASPECAKLATSKGMLPLHFAARNRKIKPSMMKGEWNEPISANHEWPTRFLFFHLYNRSVCLVLIKAHRKGLVAVNHRGNTPLHEACRHGRIPSIVELMIEKAPTALQMTNIKGERPFDCSRSTLKR